METMTIARTKISGIGTLWLAGSPRGIVRIQFGGTKAQLLRDLVRRPRGTPRAAPATVRSTPLIRRLMRDLAGHARGERVRFGARLDLCGTPFQLRVWKAIARIPWGKTRSYAWLAATAGKPRAIRAAANACGRNPIPVVIPCHRIVASDGTLGGFSGGLAMKRRLLALEGIRL
jgi:O-6-methylguanine DNA methyltransferase